MRQVFTTLPELIGALETRFQSTGNNPLEDYIDEITFVMPDGLPVKSWTLTEMDGKTVVIVSDME